MGRTVMLVEDDQDTITILQLYLERAGYQLVVALNGDEALNSIEKVDPDLIILDLMSPRLSGVEVCRCIREKSPAPIVVLTGRADEDSYWARFGSNVADHISKPFSPKQLVSRIKSVLGASGWLRGLPIIVLSDSSTSDCI